MQWLGERTTVPGWGYRPIPVEESAEKILVADRMFNGIFTNSTGVEIYAFSAKRYEEKANEIGLFIHTPDRCWVDTGWAIEPDATPHSKEIALLGTLIPAERRIFDYRGRRELVYFFGLQDGRPLPYRLDHYFSTGVRSATQPLGNKRDLLRASDTHFWARLWDSFKSRRELRGPKQFVRISTALENGDVAAADRRLEAFLPEWLARADYQEEKAAWKLAASEKRDSR